MIIRITVFLIFIASNTSLCQDIINTDSLYDVYLNSENVEEKYAANQELVWEFLESNRDESHRLFLREYENIKRSKNLDLKIRSFRIAGVFKSREGDNNAALRLLDTAYQLVLSKKEDEEWFNAWMSEITFAQGTYHSRNSDLLKSNQLYVKAIEHAELINDKSRLAAVYLNMGGNYYLSSNYSKATETYYKALELSRENGQARNVNLVLRDIGLTYKELGELDSARHYLSQAIVQARKSNDQVILLESCLGLAVVYEDLNHLDSAIQIIEKVDQETAGLNHIVGKAQIYLNLGRFQRQVGRLAEARKNLIRFNEINESSINNLYLHEQYLGSLAELESDVGNFEKAYGALYERTILYDSLLSIEHQTVLESIEAKYELTKKDMEIGQQEAVIRNQLHQRNLFLGGGILSLLLAAFFWYRKRTSDKLRAQQQSMDEQRIKQLEGEKKILSMNAMIEGQEAERIRIAKDLHDGLGVRRLVVDRQSTLR